MQLDKAIEGFALALASENKSLKYIASTQWQLQQFNLYCGDLQLVEIDAENMRSYLSAEQARGLAGHSIHAAYKSLSVFWNWCEREELISHNPIHKLRPPKIPALLPKILTREQVNALLDYLKRDKTKLGRRGLAIVSTFLDTGLRVSELCSLMLDDVNLRASFIMIRKGKGNKDRVVPLSPALRSQLWKYLNDVRPRFYPQCQNFFVTRCGRRLKIVGVQKMTSRAMRQVAINEGSCHLLRHTFATFYLLNGGDLERLRQIMGHSSLTVTQQYLHLLPQDLITRHQEVSPLTGFLHK